jgi:PIN domain nuclease of toxin-antitoxin system
MGSRREVRVLLDTHIWLWYLLGDERLSAKHRQIIEDEQTDLALSSISIWETHRLIERGRLPVTVPAAEWIQLALRTLPVREAGLTFAIAIRSRSIPLAHPDPADRFIAATAIETKAPLLTADERLLACAGLHCI